MLAAALCVSTSSLLCSFFATTHTHAAVSAKFSLPFSVGCVRRSFLLSLYLPLLVTSLHALCVNGERFLFFVKGVRGAVGGIVANKHCRCRAQFAARPPRARSSRHHHRRGSRAGGASLAFTMFKALHATPPNKTQRILSFKVSGQHSNRATDVQTANGQPSILGVRKAASSKDAAADLPSRPAGRVWHRGQGSRAAFRGVSLRSRERGGPGPPAAARGAGRR